MRGSRALRSQTAADGANMAGLSDGIGVPTVFRVEWPSGHACLHIAPLRTRPSSATLPGRG